MAGLIPQAAIDEVLDRTSLVELIDAYVPLKKKGRNHLACCPFHNEKTPSFNVIPDKQFYYCFGCGASGNAIGFLMAHLKMDFVGAVNLLAEKAGLTIQKDNTTTIPSAKPALTLLSDIKQYYRQALDKNAAVKTYMASRELTKEVQSVFELGYAPAGWQVLLEAFSSQQGLLLSTGMVIQNDKGRIYDRYRNRLVFPIHDFKGNVVGFGGRVIDPEDQPKYLNSPETEYFHKGKELYGLHLLKQTEPKQILVVEGYMDVIKLYQHGITHAVATLGTATSATHIQRLLKVTSSVVFCFDGDSAGQRAAERAFEQCLPFMADGVHFGFMFIEQGHDPDSLVSSIGKDAYLALVYKAMALDEFLFLLVQRQVSLPGNAGKSQLFDLAKPYINKLPESAFKSLVLKKLSLLTRVDDRQISHLLDVVNQADRPVVAKKQTSLKPKLSAMRVAMALLVQSPALAKDITFDEVFPYLKHTETALLLELIKIVKEKSNTAQLMEHWRETEHAGLISKLAMLPLEIPDEGRLAELKGALMQINRSCLQKAIDELLYKSSTNTITEQDKLTLQRLILEKKRLPTVGVGS